MTETVTEGGQANADSTGATAAAPVQTTQVSGGQAQTTGNGSGAVAEESFFDPRSIEGKPELQSAYKQMQGEFTRRMQGIRQNQQKLDMYSRFETKPIETMQAVAASMGYQLVQRGQDQPKEWNPQSWDDVMAEAEKRVMEKMKPVFGELKDLKKQNVEQYLDTKYSDWRTYEDAMMDTLREHPSLVKDPDKLYRLSVPQNVWESRATQAAMAKIKGATEAAQVSGGTTSRQTSSEPTGKLSFDQAVQVAKKRLASQGLTAPAN